MGKNADISWLHPSGWLPGATWSPWHGCSKKHTGCLNCWAETMSHRFGKDNWGRGKPRRVTSESGWKHPLAWARTAARAGQRMLVSPLDCDPLDAEVYQRSEAPEGVACRATFDRFMQTIRETAVIGINGRPLVADAVSVGVWFGDCLSSGPTRRPGLTYLLLTKRPENWRWIPEDVRPYCWLLYSASDQPTLDAGLPHLVSAEGFAGLGLSLEPLVGPVRLFHIARREAFWSKLRWVVCGGESGRNARPCDVAWIRAIVRQCREAGVSPYVKQLGAVSLVPELMGTGPEIIRQDREELARWPEGTRIGNLTGDPVWNGRQVLLRHPAGADPSEWPTDVQVQEWPEGLR